MFVWLFVLPLLVAVPLHLSVLAIHLSNTPSLGPDQFTPIAIFAAALIIVYGSLRALRYRGTFSFPAVALALCGIGLVTQYRIGTISSMQITSASQLALPLGIVIMLGTYWLGRYGRISRLEPFWLVFLALSVIVIIFVLVAGRKYRGAVYLPGNINPAEIIKPLLIIFIASMLSGHRLLLRRSFLGIPLPPLNILVTVGALWAPPMLLLIAQGDMGMFALMNATLIVMLYAVTNRSAYLLGGLAGIFTLAHLLIPLSSRGRARLAAWLNPFDAATSTGWQPLQALVALYTGGFWGTGFGGGSPGVVPIVESDFAYIIIGEELGLIGCACIVLLFCTLIVSGMRVAERTDNHYRATVATGIIACLGLQTLLNIGGVVKAIPLTGIPLPFISHGGSSLVTTLLMPGIILAISDDRPPAKTKKRGSLKAREKTGCKEKTGGRSKKGCTQKKGSMRCLTSFKHQSQPQISAKRRVVSTKSFHDTSAGIP
ncbi:MAG: FtsW/RodA/SpoVE family cell cycle protein [Lentisphaerae bacterium]|nr:FtsW/RodA/SpoVE family cell cycle protein [Lentisphaerota bacterium]